MSNIKILNNVNLLTKNSLEQITELSPRGNVAQLSLRDKINCNLNIIAQIIRVMAQKKCDNVATFNYILDKCLSKQNITDEQIICLIQKSIFKISNNYFNR